MTDIKYPTRWRMIAAECHRRNPDSRNWSYDDFSDFVMIDGETKDEVLQRAAAMEAATADRKGAYGEGTIYRWCGPYEIVENYHFNVVNLGLDPAVVAADEWDIDHTADDHQRVEQELQNLSSYSERKAEEERKRKAKADAEAKARQRAAEKAERATYEKLKQKFGDA